MKTCVICCEVVRSPRAFVEQPPVNRVSTPWPYLKLVLCDSCEELPLRAVVAVVNHLAACRAVYFENRFEGEGKT